MKAHLITLFLFAVSSLFAEDVSITIDEKTLHGELSITKGEPSRIAFIIPGSGPTDRDGNTVGLPGKNNSLKYLSDALNQGGIPTLRIDKRGVASSAAAAGSEEDLRFSTYVDDVRSWIAFLEKKGYSEILLIGHSEGALIATLAADSPLVKGVVSLAGAGKPASYILRDQLKPKLPENLYKQADEVISQLEKGDEVKDLLPALQLLFRPSVQPYLISWFKQDPAKEIAKLELPTLIIHGTTDIQISVNDAKLLQKSAPSSELHIIDGMNHILKEVKGTAQAQVPSYFNAELPLHADLAPIIIKFADSLKN